MRIVLRATTLLSVSLLLLIIAAKGVGPFLSRGVLAFTVGNTGPLNVAVMDVATQITRIVGDPVLVNYHPSWSPDGRWLSYKSISSEPDERAYRGFVVLDMHTGHRFSTPGFSDGDFAWSPDSTHMVHYDRARLYVLNVATEKSVSLVRHPESGPPGYAWAPDGDHVSYVIPGDRMDIAPVYLFDVDTHTATHIIDVIPFNTLHRWSPDGQYILFDDGAIPDSMPSQLFHVESGALTEPNMPRNAWAHVWAPNASEITYIMQNGADRSSFITYRYDMTMDATQPEPELPVEGFQTPYWSSNGRYVARQAADGTFTVTVSDVETGDARSYEAVRFMRWLPDGEYLLMGG
ncbi:MAG: hypothetical protein AAFR22_23835, partial [Chloroflexota bacterium]